MNRPRSAVRKIGRSLRIDNFCDGRAVSCRFVSIRDHIGSNNHHHHHHHPTLLLILILQLHSFFVCLFYPGRKRFQLNMSVMKVISISNPSKKMELNGSAVVFIALLLSCDCVEYSSLFSVDNFPVGEGFISFDVVQRTRPYDPTLFPFQRHDHDFRARGRSCP